MKKTILLLTFFIVLVSCKPNNQDTINTEQDASAKKPQDLLLENDDITKKCSVYIIHIDKNLVNQKWIDNNKNHICEYKSTDSDVKIDILTFNDFKILADSLKSYGDKIDYDKSAQTIEKMHKKSMSSSEESNLNFSKDVYEWKNLKNKLNISQNDKFKKYINIVIDASDKIVFTEYTNHYDNGTINNFSIPFFNAIEKNNGLADKDKFHFAKDNAGETVFKVVKQDGTEIKFYDISSIPLSEKFNLR